MRHGEPTLRIGGQHGSRGQRGVAAWTGRQGWAQRARRHRFRLIALIATILLLPAILSPTHPLAVYGYLMNRYYPTITPPAFAATDSGLRVFLIAPAQLQRYREDLRADMLDPRSGRLFAIVARPDGTLAQEPVRTWNGFLPQQIPAVLSRWLDQKEFTFLGDQVDLWLRGNKILAVGHYHAFGGGPSPGDRYAQAYSLLPEIVVANGLIPLVYLNGEMVPYGPEPEISTPLYRLLRTAEPSLKMDNTAYYAYSEEPTPFVKSFVGYLSAYMHVDVTQLREVVAAVDSLQGDTRTFYGAAFERGLESWNYPDHIDKESFLMHLEVLELWLLRAGTVIERPRENQPDYAASPV